MTFISEPRLIDVLLGRLIGEALWPEGPEPRRFEPRRRSGNEISPDDMRPCNHAYRIVTYRIGDMRAVMIEGPSREANEPIELGSCADVNQLANTFGT